MKKYSINYLKVLAVVATVAIAIPAIGQTTTGERREVFQGIRAEKKEFRQDSNEQRVEVRGEVRANRAEVKNEIKDIRANGASTSTLADLKEKFREIREKNIALRASTTASIKAKREVMKTDIKKRILEFKEGRKVKLDTLKKNLVKKHLANAFEKLENSIERLREFDVKISARIEEKNTAGVDVTKAEEALVSAQKALEEASVAVEATNKGSAEAVDGATELSKESLQESVKTALEAIRNARVKYADVLKALGISVKVEASTETN